MDHTSNYTDNNYNNPPTSSSSTSSTPFANNLPPPSEPQPSSSSSSSQSPFSFNAFESGGAEASTSRPFAYPYSSAPPPQTSSGRPTTSTGLLGRPGTANPNPFRQQAYQAQYGFNADPTSSSPSPPYSASDAASPSPISYASGPPPPSSRRRGASRRGLGSAAGGGPGHHPQQHQQHQHQQFGIQEEEDEYDIDEEEEEESEDEDLFAFLPPSTADQEMERQRELERQQVLQQQQLLQQQQQQREEPEPTATTAYPSLQRSAYEPPQSPPSTESNSGSRMGTSAGEFRMKRLDGAARRSGEGEVQQEAPGSPLARKSIEREEKRKSGGAASPRSSHDHARPHQPRAGVDREKEADVTDVDEDAEKLQRLGESSSVLPSPTLVSVPGPPNPPAAAEAESEQQFPRHWQHFQPNPSRSNANSGPYRRHREYHYNLAYPQYAHSTGVNVNPGAANSSLPPPSTAGSGYAGASWGYGGDYSDMEERRRRREEEREKIRRKREETTAGHPRQRRKRRNAASSRLGTAGTNATGESGPGDARTGTAGSEGYGAGSEYTTSYQNHGKGRVEDDESFDMDKKSGILDEGESRDLEYDEEYDDGDGVDSEEGSIE
ncbi:hypothetical protein H1R20_g12557, partial [Candolleomyces eurysporus]